MTCPYSVGALVIDVIVAAIFPRRWGGGGGMVTN